MSWARHMEGRLPERFAQETLGHNSKAVYRTYAKHARVTLPSLDANGRLILPDQISDSSLAARGKPRPEPYLRSRAPGNGYGPKRCLKRALVLNVETLKTLKAVKRWLQRIFR